MAEARALLGARVTHAGVTVRVTEVEAYGGAGDPASHAGRGPTPRSAVMFGPPDVLYVYLSYGMHHCANVVVGPEGDAAAVLLRAGEVIDGHAIARQRRGPVPDVALARGPACLGQALALTVADSGTSLRGGPVALRRSHPPASARTGPRVGVSKAADRPWRLWLPGESTVSAYRRSPRAPAR
ncbi:DNA-3-methyladenine glycosylase [Mumia flava]|uniref:Putative 3-methyladenine DNA glycosylase n=1 Tax=Mumia flava TaxID=1348852 RepID=A0A2M9BCY6_9ACTN|nr:DNA-3-methyladenine glycosylase [Mumia flava]PJJ55807.1 DNA-3-methyladenine glycosylase [Mumia flava]